MSLPPWTAQHAVTPEQARALIAAQGWDLALARVEPLGKGFDNTAFLVDDAWVFRFPRREIAAPLVLTEASLLPALAPSLPLPIPAPRFVGRPHAGYPWSFTGYRLMPGRPACDRTWTDAERIAAAPGVARFLAALHAIPADLARSRGAGSDGFAKLAVGPRTLKAREDLAALHAAGLLDAAALARAEVVMAAAADLGPRPPEVPVHGDLYSQHILVDDAGVPTAVIDWGDTHVGDRALDLAFAWMFFPPAGRDAFRRAYGPIDDDTWTLARFRALCHLPMDLEYAASEGEPELAREARLELAWTLS